MKISFRYTPVVLPLVAILALITLQACARNTSPTITSTPPAVPGATATPTPTPSPAATLEMTVEVVARELRVPWALAIAPELYIAVGVRGAFNHTVGLQRAGKIVAINTNPQHPMAQAADFTIVGDWQDYLEPLVNALAALGYGPT